MAPDFLSLNHITKRFAGVTALRDVSLSLPAGQITCLVGENGSGKSTLIKVIAGVYAPDGGEVVLNGRSLAQVHPLDAIREGIQVIYQDFSLFPNLSVAENLALNEQVAQNRQLINWRDVRRTAATALARIDVRLDLDARVGHLPVVDRQLIAIAKALLQNARLIIMDEPTTSLSQKEIRSLFAVIRATKQQGIGTLFVSHKLDEVLEISDRTIVMRNGEKVADEPAGALGRTRLIQLMTGRELDLDTSSGSEGLASAPVVLEAKRLASKHHFEDVSFDLRAGEILGITGLLGSGRTNLALSLFGILPADGGALYIGGKEVAIKSVQDALDCGIGYVPEDRLKEGLFLRQPIRHNMIVRIIDQLVRLPAVLDQAAATRVVDEWIDRMRIRTSSADLPVSSLSGGNQQRVVLAKWLASAPKVLILNGPTVGVDIGSKLEIHDIVRSLARQGMGLIVISDDIPELVHLCHRILLMKKGRIVAEFERERISENELNAMLVTA
jgi:simple sugar transport system ATP-binding protein